MDFSEEGSLVLNLVKEDCSQGGGEKSPNRPLLRAPTSIKSDPFARAHFSQISNMPCTPPPPNIALGYFPLHCVHSCGPLLPTLHQLGQQGPTHPSTPFVYGVLGCNLVASDGNLETMQAFRPKSRSSVSLWLVNSPGCGENCIQSSPFFSVAR